MVNPYIRIRQHCNKSQGQTNSYQLKESAPNKLKADGKQRLELQRVTVKQVYVKRRKREMCRLFRKPGCESLRIRAKSRNNMCPNERKYWRRIWLLSAGLGISGEQQWASTYCWERSGYRKETQETEAGWLSDTCLWLTNLPLLPCPAGVEGV